MCLERHGSNGVYLLENFNGNGRASTSLGYIRSTFQARQVQLALKVTF